MLVVGAGPTGLTAAIEAIRHGLTVHIVDRKPHRSTVSKALVVHARTLEVFEAMGVVDAIREAGVSFAAMHVHPGDGGDPVRVDLMALEWGDTRYPYWLSIPQYETERCLEEHLGSVGSTVSWSTSFEALQVQEGGVVATVSDASGATQTVQARWLVGCDGGRSPVREQAGLGFTSETLGETFVIADAQGNAPMPDNEGTTSLGTEGVMFLVPMPDPDRWRIIAHLPHHPEGEEVAIDAPFLDRLVAARLGFAFGAHDLTWTSQFTLKQGLAERYRSGRVFIAGDAAHLHSPVGGQGLNTGVQDAHALMWRIALAQRCAGEADALLDSYEAERRAVASSMVQGTTLATRVTTVSHSVLSRLRAFVARHTLQTSFVQNKLGRSVGMLEVRYAEGPLARGRGGGARLPNPRLAEGFLHDLLDPHRHTVLVLDPAAATQALRDVGCVVQVVPTEAHDAVRAVVGSATMVVVRPDRVIALGTGDADPGELEAYAARLGVDAGSREW